MRLDPFFLATGFPLLAFGVLISRRARAGYRAGTLTQTKSVPLSVRGSCWPWSGAFMSVSDSMLWRDLRED